jgi:hypothetical protein
MTPQALGGLARAAKLSPEQRSAMARHAARARWGKKMDIWYTTLSGLAFTHKSFEEACAHAKDYWTKWGKSGTPREKKFKISRSIPAGSKLFSPHDQP